MRRLVARVGNGLFAGLVAGTLAGLSLTQAQPQRAAPSAVGLWEQVDDDGRVGGWFHIYERGDGVYEGPIEGSGNVFFGDPNGGDLGHVHGFMYADNYFMDHVLNGTSKDPLPFEVTGFMSAGEQVQIRRDFNGKHAKMTVNFDPRVVDGSIALPGFPEREGVGEMSLLSWRFLPEAS